VDHIVEFESSSDKLDYCDTKYPIVLVSGIGFKDEISTIDYWGLIPDFLKAHGCEVYTSYQEAFNSHVDNAINLKYRVLEILEKSGNEKVNIIGHSKGGLEARYMISKLGMGDKVASLTTLGTPHRGSGFADIVVGRIPLPKFVLGRLFNIYAKLLGDEKPDSVRAAVQLTTHFMKNFNKDILDVEGVYYQSYAAHISKDYPSTMWKTLARILYSIEGKNDGLVSIESAKWGEYNGLIRSASSKTISHADIINLQQFSSVKDFSAPWFFANIIHELKLKGF